MICEVRKPFFFCSITSFDNFKNPLKTFTIMYNKDLISPVQSVDDGNILDGMI
jgi:hypothetical protein